MEQEKEPATTIQKVPADISPTEEDPNLQVCIPLQSHSSMMCVGPSNSGKSYFIAKLLRYRHLMYPSPSPRTVLYCYGVWSEGYTELEKNIQGITFHEGLPSQALIDQHTDLGHCLIVLDDLMDVALSSPLVERLFVQDAHHKDLSIVMTTQNLHRKGSCARTVALNSTYMALWRNLRDEMQIKMLGSRMGRGLSFYESFKDATSKSFGYLFCDFSPYTDDETRFRTNIFPGEATIIYVPKDGTV